MKMIKIKFYKLLILFLFLGLNNSFSQFKISPKLLSQINDSIKPNNYNDVKIRELCKIINFVSPLVEENEEFKVLYNKLWHLNKKELKVEEKIDIYYTLMIYARNNFEDLTASIKFGDSLIKVIGNKTKGYEKQIINYYSIRATLYMSNEDFEKAVYSLNEALKLYPQMDNKHYFVNIYNNLGYLYKLTYQFDKSNYYFEEAKKVVDKNSSFYKDVFKYALPDIEIENLLLKYLQEKNKSILVTIKEFQKKNFSDSLNGEWLSKWHLQNAYLNYFQDDLDLARKDFERANQINFMKKDWKIIESNYRTLDILLKLKEKKELEAIALLEDSERQISPYYEKILYEEVYNFYKNKKVYDKAFIYLEKYLTSKNFENDYKNRGEILIAQSKYNAREKEIEIENLKKIALIKKTKYQLEITLLVTLIIIILSILLYINRQLKIKKLKSEKELKNKIELIKTSLQEAENLVFEERKKIGISIHNNLLSNIVALRYKIQNYFNKSKIEKENNVFIDILDEIKIIYEDARNYSHLLTTSENKGVVQNLIPYLESIKERFNETNLLKINISMNEDVQNRIIKYDSKNIIECLIPLIKETISNTIKHTDSINYNINFTIIDDNLIVNIENDGSLIKKTQNNDKGIGLISLKNQIESIKGTFETKNVPNGFIVNVKIPLI